MIRWGFPVLLILGMALVVVLVLARVGYLGQVRWRLAKQGEPAEVVDLHS